MKRRKKHSIFVLVLVAVMLASITGYGYYTQRQIYHESTQNLLSTYSQVAKTFNMFAQRTWNILDGWHMEIMQLATEPGAGEKWRAYVKERANWQYSEAGFFSQDHQFWTVSGRQGDAPHMQAVLEEVYASEKPIVSSYISSQGVRKVIFARRIEPVTLNGVVYTTLFVSYDNSALENLLGGLAYEGQSDCYIVRANGDMVLSAEPKTEIPERITNLFDYLQKHASFDAVYFDQMLQNIPQRRSGSLQYIFDTRDYYMVYQPVGIQDWAIIGIVPTGVVDNSMRAMQSNTVLLISALAIIILFGIGKIYRDGVRVRREKAEAEKQELQRRKELTEQMFQGMARIVDRFALCDLDENHYEHHERKWVGLYPAEGAYSDLVEMISERYVVMTDGENAKLTQMLAPENLRKLLRTDEDAVKLEYAARDKSAFLLMTVVPAGWQNGRLTRVMLIAQDMGRQHLLKTLANTDALTGLLNKRYFDDVRRSLLNRSQAFGLFYLDLDRFKPVNDTYGHEMGDKLLQQIAKRLQGCVRSTDYVFRLGGDEFALLLVGELKQESCQHKVDQIKKAVCAPYEIEGRTLRIGTSCGYALYPEECPDGEQVCALADQRMYADKQKNHALLDHGLHG